MATQPVRLDRDLFDDASHTGAVMGRSAAAQVEHWARLGRAVEALPDLPHGVIAQLLSEPVETAPQNDEDHAAQLDALVSDNRTTASTFEGSAHQTLLGADEQGELVERQVKRGRGIADVSSVLTRAAAEASRADEAVESLFDHWLVAGLKLVERVDDLPGGRENLHRHLLGRRLPSSTVPDFSNERTRSDA